MLEEECSARRSMEGNEAPLKAGAPRMRHKFHCPERGRCRQGERSCTLSNLHVCYSLSPTAQLENRDTEATPTTDSDLAILPDRCFAEHLIAADGACI